MIVVVDAVGAVVATVAAADVVAAVAVEEDFNVGGVDIADGDDDDGDDDDAALADVDVGDVAKGGQTSHDDAPGLSKVDELRRSGPVAGARHCDGDGL